MEMVIKQINAEFKDNGFTYKQIKRDGLVTLYAVVSKSGKVLGYESAILTVKPAEQIRGVMYPARESYPSNEEFGLRGWSHQRLEHAEECYNDLVKSVRYMEGSSDCSPSAA